MTARGGQPVHATCVAIAGRGVLIRGASGSGKTVLGLELIRRARAGGLDAGLVADDRTRLEADGGVLTASCPPPILGKVEIRGYGIVDASAIKAGPVPLALVADLVPAGEAERFGLDLTTVLCGVTVAALRLPAGPSPAAAGAVLAALGLPPFI